MIPSPNIKNLYKSSHKTGIIVKRFASFFLIKPAQYIIEWHGKTKSSLDLNLEHFQKNFKKVLLFFRKLEHGSSKHKSG